MTRVEEPSTEDQREDADAAERLARATGPPIPEERQAPFLIQFYRSAVVKKWLMALSGIMLLGYVLAHMVGNLKVFLGKERDQHLRRVAPHPRRAGRPREVVLWILRVALLIARSSSTSSPPTSSPG